MSDRRKPARTDSFAEAGGPKELNTEKKRRRAVKQAVTLPKKLHTENMEVHHHPQVEKKSLKEYVFEGLMIFLAVMMGYFAETIRENISDNAKGKEYIRSFVQDLRRDTVSFSSLLYYDGKKAGALNNLVPCFDSIQKDSKLNSCLVPVIKNALSNKGINFTDGTMQQLKNAGGFRLLKTEDKDSIIAYDHAVRAYENYQATAFQQSQDNVRNTYRELGNFKFNSMFPDTVKSNDELPLLYSNDKALLNKFFNDLAFYRRANSNQAKTVRSLKKRATALIKYFENKYNLE